MARRCAALLLILSALTACGKDAATDPNGEQACSVFRRLAVNAYSESLTESEVVVGLQNVGEFAADSTTQAIRDNGILVGNEANAGAMISGEPNAAQDAFAEACNSTFPLNP